MNKKITPVSKTVATRSNKNILENKQHSPASALPSENPILYDNCNTLIEVTVKAKGRKRTSTMVSSNPASQKAINEKKRPGSSSDSHQSWGRLLREQNKATMKQGLQQLVTKTPGPKSSKHDSETKETKKHSIGHHRRDHTHLDDIPVKQSASQRKVEYQIKSTPRTTYPSSTSIPSIVETIVAYDRGVQCNGILDFPDGTFGVLNPVRTLNFLIKELEHLVKDEKANKILTDMQQLLYRIPVEPGKPPIMDIEDMALRTKLEATTFQLEETSRKMNSMCEALRDERDSLQRQVQKQVLLLNEARGKQIDLEGTTKTLKQELDEVIKVSRAKDKTIKELTEGIKGYECFQKIIADLKASLIDQTELARQRYLEVQYLTLEKDKLSVLSLFKDSLLVELRHSVKELQNHIADQLSVLKDNYVHEENLNPQVSLVHAGIACSSPTSTSSRDSNAPTYWRDMSDISLSTVDQEARENKITEKLARQTDENQEKKQAKDIKESQAKDSTNLNFISLPAGESSLTILPSYTLGCTDNTQSVNREKDDTGLLAPHKNDIVHKFKGDNKISAQHPNLSPGKSNEKLVDIKESKNRKSSELCKKQSSGRKSVTNKDIPNILKDNLSNNLIDPTIKEQFQNMFRDLRVQSRIPVNIPSPPRSYPHPDWIDSTLPSISTVSELNIMQSNDT